MKQPPQIPKCVRKSASLSIIILAPEISGSNASPWLMLIFVYFVFDLLFSDDIFPCTIIACLYVCLSVCPFIGLCVSPNHWRQHEFENPKKSVWGGKGLGGGCYGG